MTSSWYSPSRGQGQLAKKNKVRGRVHKARKDYESAISDLKAAKSINIENNCITDWDAIYEIEEEIASILDLLGQADEAKEVRRRIKVVSNSN